MKQFNKASDVPEFPIFKNKDGRLNAIKEYYEAGAIPKGNLINGAWYIGQSRSTEIAQWFPKIGFMFIRHKMGGSYVDHIPHFTEECETDVFIPIKRIEL